MRYFTCAVPAAVLTIALVLGAGVASAQQKGPVAWYTLDSASTFGHDASGHAHNARASGGTAAPGIHGGGMSVAGQGGLEIPSAPDLHAAGGFALDLWVRFSDVSENANIASKKGEYLLRVDPPPEGGLISFFPNAGGALEPRVRGLKPKTGVWYHIIATWNGATASLWINGQQFTGQRLGAIKPSDSPVLVGLPSQWGPAGLKGTLDDVRIYNHALSDQAVLLAQYGLNKLPAGPKATTARFEFTRGLDGWEAQSATDLHAAAGNLCATVAGGNALLLNRRLSVPVADKPFVSLRMAATAGKQAKLLLLTTGGLALLPFPLIADGAMHSYVLRAEGHSPWLGKLEAVGVVPSDQACKVRLDFLRVAAEPEAPPELAVANFYADDAINRAGRPCRMIATVRNTGGPARDVALRLTGPAAVKVSSPHETAARLGFGEDKRFTWEVEAAHSTDADFRLDVAARGVAPVETSLKVPFTPPVNLPKASYVPPPKIAKSNYLVGAMMCPLWDQGTRSGGWQEIAPWPKRKPALGWYDEQSPEVTDWQIKWALEHGIQYFVYCWYRVHQGHGVQMFLSHAIHQGLFHSRYGKEFKFAIMWENSMRGQAGVSSEKDFLHTLLPFWIKTYFKRDNYLKINGKPLLFIYRPEYLVGDLGSVAKVHEALEKARQECKKAGFAGLIVLGEYRGTDPNHLKLMVQLGCDYSFAYCWPVAGQPTPQVAVKTQEQYWHDWQRDDILPGLVTASMGWDPRAWYKTDNYWRLPPAQFKKLLEDAKAFMATIPANQLGHKMLLLDNWNEFGEGHYIMPTRQYGFGYLDAVRDVFTNSPGPHLDIVPQDVGLGPYDSGYKRYLARIAMCEKKVVAPGGKAPGLIGWWTFDEPAGAPVAYDYSGHSLGGYLDKIKRVSGPHGKALVCDGGSVNVPKAGEHFNLGQITVEAWIKTSLAGQNDKWFVNNIFGAGEAGFRLGIDDGKLAWAIPKEPWSHNLVASVPLPLGRWVHVAGTYDGQTMRLYMDGKLVGSMARGGPVFGDKDDLCIGNYAKGHFAHFTGLLSDVRIYSRALTPAELAKDAKG